MKKLIMELQDDGYNNIYEVETKSSDLGEQEVILRYPKQFDSVSERAKGKRAVSIVEYDGGYEIKTKDTHFKISYCDLHVVILAASHLDLELGQLLEIKPLTEGKVKR